MIRSVMALLLAAGVGVSAGAAYQGEPAKKAQPKGNYVKVEAKGKLATGIMAIGGETTGTTLTTDAGTFELELDKKLSGQAEKLSRKTVVVTGALYLKKRVTGAGARSIIKVATLKEAR